MHCQQPSDSSRLSPRMEEHVLDILVLKNKNKNKTNKLIKRNESSSWSEVSESRTACEDSASSRAWCDGNKGNGMTEMKGQ